MTCDTQIFGFSSSIGRISGFLGPLVYGIVSHLTGNERLGFIPVVVFLMVAFLVLATVDFEEGKRQATATSTVSTEEPDPASNGSVSSAVVPDWWPNTTRVAVEPEDVDPITEDTLLLGKNS